MGEKPDVSVLNQQLQDERLKFELARSSLKAMLAAMRPSTGAEDIIISHAYEFGADHSLMQVMADPAYFELKGTPTQDLLKQLAPMLKSATDLNHKMDEIVAMRENILGKVDPLHNRVYTWLGREFVIDHEANALRFLDTGKTQGLDAEYAATTNSMAAKGKGRDR